ncbi:MAG: DUF3593 domain-containing protein [Synechococcus sp. SB0668_bin_15]|nr:DUF3593 domain-containing protein [Synechococcus sp. SB0668_bin_15]MXZ83561.1 DUF3593 domain-containing protein [Synechococcus sp. SB0666_bin_14]MYA91109.1 DUF3593 domain-containing protein [Synechococcus sp. SB0663_bin_10]MYC49331.1 DUF3593 domain-containing protein [Synechococcus sp. SB0662_bin_14]MYG46942.1 DUF3593 domain-containing protein [Synechococcus sp. SB0675_bin_6]MYJ59566.1 DUF3593 domain-containing protein [Synechococcus sp. SB0672_bin_6]MYK91865.1 DUF3593 domain-containing pr
MSAPNLFALSLAPFLVFLWYAKRSQRFPPLAWWGFAATLVFVLVTVVAGGVAQLRFGRQLADVDPLHGGAEAFLTASNLLVALGFAKAGRQRPEAGKNPD